MNRGFDIFRMGANGIDPNGGTGRQGQMRARTARVDDPPFEHSLHDHDHHRYHDGAHPTPYGGFIGDHERFAFQGGREQLGREPYEHQRLADAQRQRYDRGAHEMHEQYGSYGGGYPPNVGPGDVWRGRNEREDFWGQERHPSHASHPDHPGLWDRVKGAFHGKGPKNYQRSDERIREDVCEHLSFHPYIDASDIEVNVKEGEVTLTGNVLARGMKRAAEDCCDHVRGVKDVHNQLRVRSEDPAEPAR